MGLSTILHARRNLLNLGEASPAGFDFATGLVANYKLNELVSETTTALDSYGTHDADNFGTNPGQVGKFGNCHSFDGGDWLSIPNHADFQFGTQPFSIRFFFNMSVVQNTIFIDKTYSTTNREFYFFYTAGLLRFRIFKYSNTSDWLNIDLPISPVADTWYEVVGTWDGTANASGIQMYVNGVGGGAASKNGAFVSPTPGAAAVLMGKHSGGYNLKGKMDEVYFWKNRLMTATDAADMHNSGNPLIM